MAHFLINTVYNEIIIFYDFFLILFKTNTSQVNMVHFLINFNQ